VTRVSFYHLLTSPLEKALPQILEKIVAGQGKAVVLCGSEERRDALNSVLWTYTPDSFLPHGTAKEGFADKQLIYLTAQVENPNKAGFLVLLDGTAHPEMGNFERCLIFFNGHDDEAVAAARANWKTYQAQGFTVEYFKQEEGGRWGKV
jgi:DNA polymerase-3 subunit chi